MNKLTKLPYQINYKDSFYHCISPKGESLGKLCAIPETVNEYLTFYPGKSNYKSLSIDFIKSEIKDKGIGSILINFVKELSKELGCEGRVHVIAGNYDKSTPPPQIFFRKQGFNTANKKHLDIIDTAIKTGNYNCKLGSTPMYLEI